MNEKGMKSKREAATSLADNAIAGGLQLLIFVTSRLLRRILLIIYSAIFRCILCCAASYCVYVSCLLDLNCIQFAFKLKIMSRPPATASESLCVRECVSVVGTVF